MKIAIIGAGSTYTPELIEGIINRAESLELTKLSLMDIDRRKLEIVGGLAKRMLETAGMQCVLDLSLDLEEALTQADFVLTQIRVGKLPARVLDEKIPKKYKLLGQETMGIGGFFKGLRSVPVLVEIAHAMERICPQAYLINFTNPAGMVTQAISDHSSIKVFGLCNVPFNMKKDLCEKLNLQNPEFDYVGLNHLSWITSIRENGHDYIQSAIRDGLNSKTMNNIPKANFPAELIAAIGGIPSAYLGYLYFLQSKITHCLEETQTRGEQCIEIEEELLKLYADPDLKEKPKLLERRGGANYSLVAISLVDAIYNDKKEIHVVNTRNSNTLPFMDEGDVIEVSAVIGKDGAQNIAPKQVNVHISSLMKQVKAYERFAIEAALSGNYEEAIRAMLANPMIADYHLFKPCFDELLEVHKEYLPLWKR